MIFSSQPGWAIIQHGVRHAAEGPPLHFFTWPIVAWRHEKGALIPMTFEALDRGQSLAVLGPDGMVSTGVGFREDRTDYEARVIAKSDVALEELHRRWDITSETQADAKLAAMTSARAA
jgi:hypothetical protein